MSPGAEIRRNKVLEILEGHTRKYAYFTSGKPIDGFVYLCIGIRDVGTVDLKIPEANFDPFKLLKIINGATQ